MRSVETKLAHTCYLGTLRLKEPLLDGSVSLGQMFFLRLSTPYFVPPKDYAWMDQGVGSCHLSRGGVVSDRSSPHCVLCGIVPELGISDSQAVQANLPVTTLTADHMCTPICLSGWCIYPAVSSRILPGGQLGASDSFSLLFKGIYERKVFYFLWKEGLVCSLPSGGDLKTF